MNSLYLQTPFALFLFSLVAIGIKYVHANPFTIGFTRLLIASFGFFLLMRNRKQCLQIIQTNFLQLFIIGIVFCLHWITYFYSIKLGGASLGFVALSTYGIQVMILGAIFLGHKFKPIHFVGVLISFIGTICTIPEYTFKNQATIGFLIGTISGFLYALMPILNQKNQHIPTQYRIFTQFLFSLICFSTCLPLCNWELSQNDWIGLIMLGTFGTLLAHSLWTNITSKIPTSITAVVYYTNVPLTIYWGHLFLGEVMNPRQLVGVGLIVLGSLLNLKR